MRFPYKKISLYTPKPKENIINFIKNFILYKNRFIFENNLENNYECIGKADETPIWLDPIENRKIDIKDNKDINMITFWKEKERVSVMLTILGNGNRLPPMIIFKGEENETKYQQLIKNQYAISKKIFIGCQIHSWFDENIYMKYLNNIWFGDSIYKRKERTLLIINRAILHYSNDINSIFEINKSKYILLPLGLTSIIQPIDLVINEPFKNNIRVQYRNCLQNRKNENEKLTHDMLINFVYNAWYKDEIITKNMIINSFNITGLTKKLDVSENHLIKCPENYIEFFSIEYSNNDNEIEFNNYNKINPILELNYENINV